MTPNMQEYWDYVFAVDAEPALATWLRRYPCSSLWSLIREGLI